jgi:hypothetical protein
MRCGRRERDLAAAADSAVEAGLGVVEALEVVVEVAAVGGGDSM